MTAAYKTIYEVKASWNKPARLCATPREAADTVMKALTPSERKAVSIDVLTSLIKPLTNKKEFRIFDTRIERRTLFG